MRDGDWFYEIKKQQTSILSHYNRRDYNTVLLSFSELNEREVFLFSTQGFKTFFHNEF